MKLNNKIEQNELRIKTSHYELEKLYYFENAIHLDLVIRILIRIRNEIK